MTNCPANPANWKSHLSPVLYATAVALAFVQPWISCLLYVVVAVIWLVPDPRIERALTPVERTLPAAK